MATVANFAAPQGPARSRRDPFATLRWASHEPTKVATIAQFAAPRGGEASLWSACGRSPLGLPGAHESGGSFAVRNP